MCEDEGTRCGDGTAGAVLCGNGGKGRGADMKMSEHFQSSVVLSEQCGIVRAVRYCQSSAVLSEQCGIVRAVSVVLSKQ